MFSRRPALIGFLMAFGAALVVVVALGLGDKSPRGFTLGVNPGLIAIKANGGQRACQDPINVAESFDRVRFRIGTFLRPAGPPVQVEVLEGGVLGRTIARAEIPGGYADNTVVAPTLSRTIPKNSTVTVCITNRGDRAIALYGDTETARLGTHATLDGRIRPVDLDLTFDRGAEESIWAQIPDLIRHASVFHAPWVGPWTFWLLSALVLLAVPALLIRALATAWDDEPES